MRSSASAELRAQLRTSIPATLGMLLYKIPWLLSLAFVGNIGTKELAAAALATTLCNVTGMSLSVGLSSAITTLAGQARGQLLAQGQVLRREEAWKEKRREGNGTSMSTPTPPPPLGEVVVEVTTNRETSALLNERSSDIFQQYSATPQISERASDTKISSTDNLRIDSELPILPLVFLYRGILIQLVFVLPVGAYWLFGIKPLLLFLGQGEEISAMTETYLRILTPGLWSYSINWTLTAWLQAIELADVPAWAALAGALLHVPFNLFFIHVVGLGWLGVGVATTMFQLIQPIVMFAYLKATPHRRARLLEHVGAKAIGRTYLSFWREAHAAVSSFNGICQYLKLALPGIVAISEWWASELSIFLSGRLHPAPDVALGAMAVYQSLNTTCFMFPVGMSVGGSARIGSALGAGNISKAREAARVCVSGAAILSATLGCILYLAPHNTFPSLFTSDADLIEMTSLTIPLLSLYVFADGQQVALNAIIKGCGRQCALIPIILISYWIIALPLSWYFAFVKSGGSTDCDGQALCGVVGLVAGLTIGTCAHYMILGMYIVCTIDWPLEAKLAKERLAMEKEQDFCGIDDQSATRDDGSLASMASVKAINI